MQLINGIMGMNGGVCLMLVKYAVIEQLGMLKIWIYVMVHDYA